MRGHGDSVPKSVELVHESLTVKVPIWVEISARVVTDAQSEVPTMTQRFDEGTDGQQDESLLGLYGGVRARGPFLRPEYIELASCHKT